MKIFSIPIILSLVLVGAGCTTLNDFKQMSPHQRAQVVCSNQQNFRQLSSQVNSLQRDINFIERRLARGYAIHRQCHEVTVERPSSRGTRTECYQRGDRVVCEERTPPPIRRNETRCVDTPVAIDANHERANLQRLQQQLTNVNSQRGRTFNSCYNQVIHMTPEQAFQLR